MTDLSLHVLCACLPCVFKLLVHVALESMLCMLSQHHAIGLQTDCMVAVLAPVVEAARLPRVCPMALGYGLPPL